MDSQIEEKRIREWFKDHVATLSADNGIEILSWRNRNGRSLYFCEYWCKGGILAIHGDLGFAVFRWGGSEADLKWIATCDLYYFHGKCEASEAGKSYNFYDWSPEQAWDKIKGVLKQNPDYSGKWKEYGGSKNLLGDRNEWLQWLQSDGYEVFGDICEMGNEGNIIPLRCEAWLIGLKMAFEQLAKGETSR